MPHPLGVLEDEAFFLGVSSCGDKRPYALHTPHSVSLRSCLPSARLFVDVIDDTHTDRRMLVGRTAHQTYAVDIHLVGNT